MHKHLSGIRRHTRARSASPLLAAAMLTLSVPSAPTLPTAGRAPATGRDWGTGLACLGCVAGTAGIIASGGTAALVTAAFFPGSTLIVAGCVYSCYDVIRG